MTPRPGHPAHRHSAFWRYTAFQVPGWVLAALGGWWLHRTMDIPPWIASGVLVVWVIKDYALYPMLRFAYEADHRLPIERLIGARGTAVEPLDPVGYVRVRGELWRATSDRTDAADQATTKGDTVEIVSVDGTTLVVRRAAARPGEA